MFKKLIALLPVVKIPNFTFRGYFRCLVRSKMSVQVALTAKSLSRRLIVMLALNVVELGYHVVKYFVSS